MIPHDHKLSAGHMLAAVLAASAALANEPEWQEVASNDEVVVEVDTANIRVREEMLTAWVRLTTPRDMDIAGRKFRSAVSLTVFDCDAEKSGVSTTTAFAGPRGEGKIVHTEEGLPVHLTRLSYERPGTTGYEVLEFACKRAHADQVRVSDGERAMRAQEEPGLVREAWTEPTGAPARITRPVNPDDYYPPGSIRREEQGSPVVQACVGPNGRLVRDPVVTDTSGFPDLDSAAVKVAKATRYAAGTDNGSPLPESCIKFKVKFGPRKY